MVNKPLSFSYVACVLLLLVVFLGAAPAALTQGPIILDGLAGAGEWDPGWQVASDGLDVFITETGAHPHEAPTYARTGYDAIGLWAHYAATAATWYFRLDVDGRVGDSDSVQGTGENLGVGTHGENSGPLMAVPFVDDDGIGPSEVYELEFQYDPSVGPSAVAELGDDSALLPGVIVSTTAGLAGQAVYSETIPGILEWAFARDVIFPNGSNYGELWLAAHLDDHTDRVSYDDIPAVLLVGLGQSVGCPVSPAIQGYPATFTATYTVPHTAALPVHHVSLAVDVPVGATFMGASGDGNESEGVITWELGDRAPGDTGQVTFTLRVDDALASLPLESEITSVEGLRLPSSVACPVREPHRLYLPVIHR